MVISVAEVVTANVAAELLKIKCRKGHSKLIYGPKSHQIGHKMFLLSEKRIKKTFSYQINFCV